MLSDALRLLEAIKHRFADEVDAVAESIALDDRRKNVTRDDIIAATHVVLESKPEWLEELINDN